MKKAIVVGALSQAGYQLVQKLLLEEMEVMAFDMEHLLAMSPTNEEKLLRIGRHANFFYDSLYNETAWREACTQDIEAIYICLPKQEGQTEAPVQRVLADATAYCEEQDKLLIVVGQCHDI